MSGEKIGGTIVLPDGSSAMVQYEMLDHEDAKLLRDYKRFLRRKGYREALWCNACHERNMASGTEAHVTDDDVLIRCRCRQLFYKGPTA